MKSTASLLDRLKENPALELRQGVYAVGSDSDADKFYVCVLTDDNSILCTCPGYQNRDTCKHSYGVGLMLGTAGEIPVPKRTASVSSTGVGYPRGRPRSPETAAFREAVVQTLAVAGVPVTPTYLYQLLTDRGVQFPGSSTTQSLVGYLKRMPEVCQPGRGLYQLKGEE